MKHFNQININKTRNHLTKNFNFGGFNSFSSFDGLFDPKINEDYKQYIINQMKMQLDTKMLGLIAKMTEEKIFESLKSEYDEDKRALMAKILKNSYNSGSDFFMQRHLNLKNFQNQLNRNYTYDASDNQIINSFFNKIKTRKRKVIRKKENYYIDILYHASNSPKKMKNIQKKEKPKFNFKLLLKSNSDLEAYIKRREEKLNIKKVTQDIKDNDEQKEYLKIDNENSKTMTRLLNKKNKVINRRKSAEKIPFSLKNNESGLLVEDKKNMTSLLNTYNIKIKNKFNTNRNIKERKMINENDSNKDITFSSYNNQKINGNKTLTVTRKNESFKMDLLKNNIIKVSKLIKNKSLTKELEKSSQSNLFKKEMNKTSLDNLFKDEMMPLKFKLSVNERIQYMNRINKKKFDKVISIFNEKEKKIERKYTKINELITDLKNRDEKIESDDKIKSADKKKKLIYLKKEQTPKKTPRLLYKEWNETNSLFHFPIINRAIYKNEKQTDDIDIIKTNLRKQYKDKVKRNRQEYIRKIDGKRIIKKLNDKFEIERLKEYSNKLKEKQRINDQFEVYEI